LLGRCIAYRNDLNERSYTSSSGGISTEGHRPPCFERARGSDGADRLNRMLAPFGVVVLTTVGLASCGSGGTTSGGGNVVAIGLNESLSGNSAVYGLPNAVGVRLAVKKINDAGGFQVGGKTYTFKVTEIDNRSDGAQAVSAAVKLTGDNGIKFLG